jgi:pimeloyl-ACP methyl ester carboxylesterase
MEDLPPIQFITTDDGVRLAYCVHGSGQPLVLVGGWVTHLQLSWEDNAFRSFFEELAMHVRLVRFDARANGLSEWGAEGLDLDGFATDVEAIMDGLGLSTAVVWGTRSGAPIAITYAARHPERVSRLIVDSSYATVRDLYTPDRREAFEAMLTAMRVQPDAINASFLYMADPESLVPVARRVEDVRRSIRQEDLARLYALAAEYDVTPLLREIKAPTLVLHRRGGKSLPVSLGQALAAGIPNAEFVGLDGSVASLWHESPADGFMAIAKFLGLDVRVRPPFAASPRPEPAQPPPTSGGRPPYYCKYCLRDFTSQDQATGHCLYSRNSSHLVVNRFA